MTDWYAALHLLTWHCKRCRAALWPTVRAAPCVNYLLYAGFCRLRPLDNYSLICIDWHCVICFMYTLWHDPSEIMHIIICMQALTHVHRSVGPRICEDHADTYIVTAAIIKTSRSYFRISPRNYRRTVSMLDSRTSVNIYSMYILTHITINS